MRYRTIIKRDDANLDAAVEKALEKGWKLQGGLSMTSYSEFNAVCDEDEIITLFGQALYKEEDDEEDDEEEEEEEDD